jgi:hypothetical protein
MKYLPLTLILCGCGQQVPSYKLTWEQVPNKTNNVYVNNSLTLQTTNTTCILPLNRGDQVYVTTLGVEGKSETLKLQ